MKHFIYESHVFKSAVSQRLISKQREIKDMNHFQIYVHRKPKTIESEPGSFIFLVQRNMNRH